MHGAGVSPRSGRVSLAEYLNIYILYYPYTSSRSSGEEPNVARANTFSKCSDTVFYQFKRTV